MLKILENYPLKPLNTFGIEATARYYTEVSTPEEIREFLQDIKLRSLPLFILGGGSNILLMNDFNGVVLKINLAGKFLVGEDQEHVFIKAGAGEIWHELVLHCIEKNYAGIENLSLIPGCVGAAPMQNIGAYGVELKDVFYELEAIMIDTMELRTFSTRECRFGYRESIFKNELKGKCIIVSVTLKLNKHPKYNTRYGAIEEELIKLEVSDLNIRAISDAVCSIRRSKLPNPAEFGNAGSFFKNPTVLKEKYEILKSQFPDLVAYPQASENNGEFNSPVRWKLAAGWLIEKAGWKGKRFDGYGVHAKQALVLVNYGGATGSGIYKLSELIIDDIKQKFGVQLEREVNVIR